MTKCWKCKQPAWCFDDDGKTPYCKKCWKEKTCETKHIIPPKSKDSDIPV